MSAKRRSGLAVKAEVFAALGDETRLLLLTRLQKGQHCSITELTSGTRLTRQAVTKHLRVLQRARIVRARRDGRESLFTLDPEPMKEMAKYLDAASSHWDVALERLKDLVERGREDK